MERAEKSGRVFSSLIESIILTIFAVYNYLNKLLISLIDVKSKLIRTFKLYDIEINGPRSWDIQVRDERFYSEVASNLLLGLGETYMDGCWDSKQLDETIYRLLQKRLFGKKSRFYKLITYFLYQLQNRQTKDRAFIVGQQHYDLGNDLYEKMLDPTMTYSCGYWKDAKDLNEAQLSKLKLIAEKLQLEPGMSVLDIGCGWGGLAKYLAENYHVKVVGITISIEQQKMAKERCSGLDVDIRLCDYRDINETFDRIVSVGMLEHVGEQNFRTFFLTAHNCLTRDGVLVVHTMGFNNFKIPTTQPFIDKYIFPNGMFPRLTSLIESFEGKFVLEDLQNIGYDYYPTLMSWNQNFEKSWPELSLKYDDRFYRMWKFYLSFSAASLRSRKLQVYHFVLSKNGIENGYRAPR